MIWFCAAAINVTFRSSGAFQREIADKSIDP